MPTSDTRIMKICRKGAENLTKYPVAASQTLYQGDFVYLNSGKVTLAAAAGANIADVHLYVMAQDSISQAVDTLVAVERISPDTHTFILPLTTNGSAQAYAITQAGVKYEVRHISGTRWHIDVNATTNTVLEVVSECPDYTGDTWGVVFAKPIATRFGL